MHIFHRHHHKFFMHRELDELYLSIALRAFGLSMITIFIPIYLLKLNYSITQILWFFIIFSLSHTLAVVPAAKIGAHKGFKHAILYSIPLAIVTYLMLYSLEQFTWPLWIIALIFGIESGLYWVGYHIDFAMFSHKKERGHEISRARIMTSIGLTIGPLVGSFLLTQLGFQAVFIFVCLLLIVSVVPLFFSKDVHKKIECPITKIWKDQELKHTLSYCGLGIELAFSIVVWPIIIFTTILNNYTELGFVASVFLFASLIGTFIIGHFSDLYRRLVLRVGSLIRALVWFCRASITTIRQIVFTDSIAGLAHTAVIVPFDAINYDEANRKKEVVSTIMYREACIQLAKTATLIALLFFADLRYGLILASLGSLLHFFI